MEKYILGIDLGGTSVKLGLISTEGELISKWEIPTPTENAGENILPAIASSLPPVLEELGLSREQLMGAGLGVPGAVLDGSYVKPCVNLGGWGGDVAAAPDRMRYISVWKARFLSEESLPW